MVMIEIELTDSERSMLLAGINEWGGPAAVTDELAVAMGFAGREDLHDHSNQLHTAVRTGSALPGFDWARVLVMTEFVFASDVFGSGMDWSTTTGIPDTEAIATLRSLQRKFSRAGAARSQFSPTSHQEYQWHSSAATAIRIFKHGRSDLQALISALAETVESFGEDLETLEQTAAKLEELRAQPEREQREAAMAEFERLESSLADRLGGRRRMFWL